MILSLLYWKGFILSITKGVICFDIERVAFLMWTLDKSTWSNTVLFG